jgi:hypothetical protein
VTGLRTVASFTSPSGTRTTSESARFGSLRKLQAFGEKLRPRMDEAGIQLSGEPEIFQARNFETFA